jgi:8-oxo-dGTP pyrophosphatase MutT (NUDIX family)
MHSAAEVTAAGLILRRPVPDGQRFLLLRARKHREWGFPKGHQDPGEDLLATALRECREECGIADAAVDADPLELFYHLPDGRLKRVVYWPAITATEAIALSHEHDEGVWCTADDASERLPHEGLRRLFQLHLRRLGG